MKLQDLYLRHLENGQGAHAVLKLPETSEEEYPGDWCIKGPGEFFFLPKEKAPGGISRPTRVHVKVFLPTGVHSFSAVARRTESDLIRITPLCPVRVENQRKHIRVRIKSAVSIWTDREHMVKAEDVIDVSPLGIGLRGELPLNLGQSCELAFVDPPWKDVGILKAKVVRAEAGKHYGLQFTSLDRETSALLVHLVASEVRSGRQS